MAADSTNLTDVIIPEVFAGYIMEEDLRTNRLVNSGAVVSDPAIAGFLAGGGQTFQIPGWQSTDQDDENVSSDDETSDGAQNAVLARKQIAIRSDRNGIWRSADLVAMLAGSDPLANAAARISQFRMTKRQNGMLSILDGLLDTGDGVLASSHTNSIAEKATAAAPLVAEVISAGGIIDTLAPSADEQGANLMVVHSDVHRDLQKKNLITFQSVSTQDIGWGTYLGFTLVVDDAEGAAAGAMKIAGGTDGYWYKTYLLQPGAVSITTGAPRIPVEIERQAVSADGGGVESLIVRDQWACHVYGTSFTGLATIAGASPTNAEYATGTNYAKVFADKKIGVACLEHNIGVGA